MDFNFKKIANDASGFFTRAKQYTEETFLNAERTELDAHFELLLQRADKTEEHTKKLLTCIESYLQPNPTLRMEEVFYEKLELKKDANRMNNLEHLGQAMVEAGNEFGATTPYGVALLKVAQTEKNIGQLEHEFIGQAAANTLLPIRRFLEGDMRTIQAEADLRVAQSEFDKQCEITKLLLEGIQTAHNNQLKCVRDFVDVQTNFYAQAHQQMADLQRELSGNVAENGLEVASLAAVDKPAAGPKTRQARAIMDYAPLDRTEIELRANEVVIMYGLPGMDVDYVMVEKMGRRGKVPLTFLQEL